MSEAISIRRAVDAELPAVLELCMLVEEQHERYWPLRWQRKPNIREGWLRWMRSRLEDPRLLILAATVEQPPGGPRVVGALLASIETEIPIYTYKEFAFVHDIAVVENFRRRGVARDLLARAAEWAAGLGMNQLRLMAADKNVEARRLFEAAGFRPTYHEMILPVGKTEAVP